MINLPLNNTTNHCAKQLILPLNMEVMIAEDAPVRLLDSVLEELNYDKLLNLYSKKGRKLSTPAPVLFKIIIFGMVEGIYSLRKLEKACKENINFMWLLEGRKAPSHMAFGRFYSTITTEVLQDLFAQFIFYLGKIDSVNFDEVYIDGTKIEANANRYSFVWKRSIQKFLARIPESFTKLQIKAQNLLGNEALTVDLEGLFQILEKRIEDKNIEFVYGRGTRKTEEQRLYEEAKDLIDRETKYHEHLEIMGDRNSYSKTDHSATFMHLKEDHMRNGQLKPAYNVQLAVQSEYIVGLDIFPKPTDTKTLIPFVNTLLKGYGYPIKRIVADAGYDSEENLNYLHQISMETVIKPRNYEVRRKRSYKKRIGAIENMKYDPDLDVYYCAMGLPLSYVKTYSAKTGGKYRRYLRMYKAGDCTGCPLRKECQPNYRNGLPPKSNKTVSYSPLQRDLDDINFKFFNSDLGILQRINRSIQVEGAFGILKQDKGFKRFARRGKDNVLKELLFICFGFNVLKLHNRIKNGRIGQQYLAGKSA